MSGLVDESDWGEEDPLQLATLKEFLGDRSYVWLYRSSGDIGAHSVGEYSALLPSEAVERALADPGWEVMIGDGAPGFCSGTNESGDWVTEYERYYQRDGAQLLVLSRSFDGVRPSHLELVEELRLLFNLWEDRRTGTFYEFGPSGEPIEVASVTERGVKAQRSLVRRYQAAKQMHLALFIDSTNLAADLPEGLESWERADDSVVLHYYRDGERGGLGGPFPRLFGKRIIPPPPVEDSLLPPFDRDRGYETFVIGVDANGKEVTYTSDPDQLANYFGKNPDAPHYLTPVFFRKDALRKYYGDDLYKIEDGYLRCAGIWGLRLDNDLPDHVMVYLGDLGRDIPPEEARYWRSYNVPPPESGRSETNFRRSILGQFADPKSVELLFRRAYRATSSAWEKRFGYPLFRELHEDDRHILDRLHVPLGDSQGEFDEQIGYLAKLVVDYLNEAAITDVVGKGERDERGLRKLERLLEGLGAPDVKALVQPLAAVQGLRSRGAAHAKGTGYDLAIAIGDLPRRQGFENLLTGVMDTLGVLQNVAGGADES